MTTHWGTLLRGVAVLAGVVLSSQTGLPQAHAAGVEDTVGGTVALGRSAGYVRANDYQAVWQNPSNLALLPSKDVGLELRLPVFNACFSRAQNPASTYLPSELPFEKVCNEGGVMASGSVGFSMPLPKGFGFGVGIYTPGGVPKLKFGNSDINTVYVDPRTEVYPGTTNAHESPNRYLLIDKTVLAAFVMAGVGYSPIPQLRFGLSVGGGLIDVKFKNVSSLSAPGLTDNEVLSDLSVRDSYVPRTTLAVSGSPIESLDLLATFTYTGDISAEGDLKVTGNGITQAPVGDCASATPGPRCEVKGVTLKIPYQRYEVLLGARYAQRRGKRERSLDPMKDEVWDVEVNAYWSQTSHVDNYTLQIRRADQMRQVALSSDPAAGAPLLPTNATLYHGWKDTFGVRVGGDYNVLPQRLAVRAGLGYESRGVPTNNMNLDYWPVQKVSLSLGATVKLGRWKIHAAYAHVFNEQVNVKVGEGNVREVVAIPPPAGVQAASVNEGKYTSRIDVFSLQGNVSF
jgi:long-subunit fatty acid transport protein